MFYHILYPLKDILSFFNIFRYITFRAAGGFVFSFLSVIFLGGWFIHRLKRMRIQEHIDMYGNVHLEKIFNGKKGTPTMGGIMIICSVVFSSLLWARLDNVFVWVCLASIIWFGFFGFLDDYLKMKTKKGLSRGQKLLTQVVFGLILGFFILYFKIIPDSLTLPFFKEAAAKLGVFYVLWAVLVLVCTTNAVNFTDGLDGLAIGSIVMVSFVFIIVSYIAGNVKFSSYLFIPYIPGGGEVSIICASIVGAGLGFLWFNCYPAQVFMGDVGSLALGGVLGVIALLIKEEYLLVVAGGLFVLEGFSVLLQILSVKLRSKKVFKAAPLHHHYQILNLPESKITVRFWIISVILAVISLATLKIR